jgi:hypothetical protein
LLFDKPKIAVIDVVVDIMFIGEEVAALDNISSEEWSSMDNL